MSCRPKVGQSDKNISSMSRHQLWLKLSYLPVLDLFPQVFELLQIQLSCPISLSTKASVMETPATYCSTQLFYFDFSIYIRCNVLFCYWETGQTVELCARNPLIEISWKDTSIKAIILRHVSRLKPSDFMLLSVEKHSSVWMPSTLAAAVIAIFSAYSRLESTFFKIVLSSLAQICMSWGSDDLFHISRWESL